MNYYTIIVTLVTSIFLVNCQNQTDKSKKLQKLLREQAELAKQIETLEQEISKTDSSQNKIPAKEVVIIDLQPRRFDKYVQTQGSVEATDNIMVTSKTVGIITHVFVRVGDAVVKGQTLAQLDNSVLLKSIDELKSGLELANTIYERQRNLWNQKIGTEVQYLQAKNNKESLEKKLATLQEQSEMAKIKSLINGVVDDVQAKVGQNTAPGMPAFRIVNNNDMHISAKISEAYLAQIKKGNKAIVSFSEYDKKIEGAVSFVGKNIDSFSRSFGIEVNLPSSADLRPNMTGTVRIIFKTIPNALCVPINIIQEINGEKIVYVAEQKGKDLVARRKVIKIDGVYENQAQVISGLSAGDKVITIGYQGLNDLQFIKI